MTNALESPRVGGWQRSVWLPVLGTVFLPRDPSEAFPVLSRVPLLGHALAPLFAFLAVPKVKMINNLLLSLSYYAFFVHVLVGWPPWYGQRDWMIQGRYQPLELSRLGDEIYMEALLWFWTLLRLVEEIKQIVRQGAAGYTETRRLTGWFAYFESGGNLLDLFNYCSVILSMIIRLNASLSSGRLLNGVVWSDWNLSMQACQCLYAFSSITLISRCAYLLAVYESFGVLVLMTIRVLVKCVTFWLPQTPACLPACLPAWTVH